jgi:hypothetical protein
MQFGFAADRLLLFVLISIFTVHLFGCLWLFAAGFILDSNANAKTWLDLYLDYTPWSRYLAAIYKTIVMSYGGIDAKNNFEMIFGILIMIGGGFLMTYAISVIGQIVVSMDKTNAAFEEKMEVLKYPSIIFSGGILNRIKREYFLPLDLYLRLKKSLRYKYDKDTEDLNHFIDELPPNLKIETAPFIHESTW